MTSKACFYIVQSYLFQPRTDEVEVKAISNLWLRNCSYTTQQFSTEFRKHSTPAAQTKSSFSLYQAEYLSFQSR